MCNMDYEEKRKRYRKLSHKELIDIACNRPQLPALANIGDMVYDIFEEKQEEYVTLGVTCYMPIYKTRAAIVKSIRYLSGCDLYSYTLKYNDGTLHDTTKIYKSQNEALDAIYTIIDRETAFNRKNIAFNYVQTHLDDDHKIDINEVQKADLGLQECIKEQVISAVNNYVIRTQPEDWQRLQSEIESIRCYGLRYIYMAAAAAQRYISRYDYFKYLIKIFDLDIKLSVPEEIEVYIKNINEHLLITWKMPEEEPEAPKQTKPVSKKTTKTKASKDN